MSSSPATLEFQLVSPEKLVTSKQATLVTVPGGEGDYGVLFGHAPMITTVKAGVIEVFAEEGGAPSDRIFVAGGFAEVTQTRCTVLAEEAVPVAELDRTLLEDQARKIAEQIVSASATEIVTLQNTQALLAAKLRAVP